MGVDLSPFMYHIKGCFGYKDSKFHQNLKVRSTLSDVTFKALVYIIDFVHHAFSKTNPFALFFPAATIYNLRYARCSFCHCRKRTKKSSLPEGEPRAAAMTRKQFALQEQLLRLRSSLNYENIKGEAITLRVLLPLTARQTKLLTVR